MISNSIFHMNFREDLNETFKKRFNSMKMEKPLKKVASC